MTRFASFDDLRAACLDLPTGDDEAATRVASREGSLTKPPRSLGRLEETTAWLARWQGQSSPRLEMVEILVFADNQRAVDDTIPAFKTLAKAINPELDRLFPAPIEILAEPGRFLVASAATAISKIIGKAVRDGKLCYYVNDGV